MPSIIEYDSFAGITAKPSGNKRARGIGVYAKDVDFSRGTLSPMRSDRRISIDTGNTLYLDHCCLKVYDDCVNITQDDLRCKRIFATGVPTFDYPVQATPNDMCQDNWCKIGFDCVMPPPTVDYAAKTETADKTVTRSYMYTYVNQFGEESAPSFPSDIVTIDFDIVANLTLPTPPANICVKTIRIYALIAGMENGAANSPVGDDGYYLVGEVAPPNTAFEHNMASGTVGAMNTTEDYDHFPSDARDLNHWGENQLIFLSGGKVRFTEPWNYSVAPEKYILGLHNYPEKLIASRNYGYVLTCSNAEVIDLRKDCNQGGCHTITQIEEIQPIVGKLSADIHDDGVAYASTEGLIYLRGASSGNLTMNIFNKQQWLDLQPHTMRGVVHNGYYYGSTDTDTFRLLMPTSANGSEAEQFSYLSIKAKAWFRTRDNRLLYTDDTGTHEFQEGDSFKEYEFVSVRSHTFRPVIAANFMLHADCGKVDASVAMDNKRCGITATDLAVRGNRQYRVKKQLAYGHQVTIKGTAEVFAFTLGTGTI
jgi:hypothetical protein